MQYLVDDLDSLAPTFLKALSVPLLACDVQGRIVYTNPAAESQLNAEVGPRPHDIHVARARPPSSPLSVRPHEK